VYVGKRRNAATANAAIRSFFEKKRSRLYLQRDAATSRSATTTGTHISPFFDETIQSHLSYY
jgi:hypothetical protein